MANGDSSSHDAYETVLADLRAQRDKIDQTIELIESLRGGGKASSASATQSQNAATDEGAFLGMTIADAAVKLLNQRHRALGNAEILQEFKRGGLVLSSADPLNVVNSVLTRRFNQAGDIVRVDRGVWGLQQWYPGRNFKKKHNSSTAASTEPDKTEEQQSDATVASASAPLVITNAMRDKLHEYGATDDDIKDMTPAEAQSYINSFE